MRALGIPLIAGLLFLGGCGGGTTTVIVSTPSPATTTTAAPTTAPSGNARIHLVPIDGSSANGYATLKLGRKPALSLSAVGLQPTGPGENYIIWLYSSDTVAFPLGRDTVGSGGTLTGTVDVPQVVVRVLPGFTKIRVSRATNAETQAALSKASGSGGLPAFVGVPVLEGDAPSH